ncbi:MAG: hypothetical protein ACPG4U_13255 [Pseudomonadales bacterium]
MKKTTRALLFATVLVAASGLYALSSQQTSLQAPSNQQVCDILSQHCTLRSENGDIELSLESALKVMQPNSLTLHSDNSIERAQISFQGADMYMGINQFSFARAAQREPLSSGIELPLCTTGTMLWQADLTIERNGQSERFSFTFNL